MNREGPTGTLPGRYAFHEDVVGPARGSVEELDDVVGGADHPCLEVRRAQEPARRLWKTPRHEASWDAVGSTYSLCWSAGSAVAPDPLTFVMEGRSSVLTKAARSPVVAGSAQGTSGV